MTLPLWNRRRKGASLTKAGLQPGVQQGPPVVELDEHGGHGLDQDLVFGPTPDRDRLGQHLPAEQQGYDRAGHSGLRPGPGAALGQVAVVDERGQDVADHPDAEEGGDLGVVVRG